jgi:hypothetical protein
MFDNLLTVCIKRLKRFTAQYILLIPGSDEANNSQAADPDDEIKAPGCSGKLCRGSRRSLPLMLKKTDTFCNIIKVFC